MTSVSDNARYDETLTEEGSTRGKTTRLSSKTFAQSAYGTGMRAKTSFIGLVGKMTEIGKPADFDGRNP